MDSSDGVENLHWGEAPAPEPGPDAVVLNWSLAALTPADAFLAKGMYPAKPAFPHILGRDGVGDVIATGAGVNGVASGSTVGILRCEAGVSIWGTLADKVAVPAASIVPI